MRHLIACLFIALLSVFAAMEHYRRNALVNNGFPDVYRIGEAADRYAELARRFPDNTILGYVSNQDLGTATGGALYFGAQMALAPRILVRSDHPEAGRFVLGNFPPSEELDTTIAQTAVDSGLDLVEDLGNGVVLYEKRNTQ